MHGLLYQAPCVLNLDSRHYDALFHDGSRSYGSLDHSIACHRLLMRAKVWVHPEEYGAGDIRNQEVSNMLSYRRMQRCHWALFNLEAGDMHKMREG